MRIDHQTIRSCIFLLFAAFFVVGCVGVTPGARPNSTAQLPSSDQPPAPVVPAAAGDLFLSPPIAAAQSGLSPLSQPTTQDTGAAPTAAMQDSTVAGRILWHSDRSGSMQVWIMDGTGGNQRQLTQGDKIGTNAEPAWSPDGEQIAFVSDRDDDQTLQIYVMDADSSNQRPLMPFHPSHNWFPNWSPDGSQILFQTNRAEDANYEIYLVNADGTDLHNLSNNPANDSRARWAPDGKRIVFVSDRNGNRDIYVMNIDGSDVRQLTDAPEEDDLPAWSPDGQKIVFQSNRGGGGSFTLYVVDADGSDIHLVGGQLGNVNAPTWANNGREIVFAATHDASNWEIYLIGQDGRNLRHLTNDPQADRFPVWHR